MLYWVLLLSSIFFPGSHQQCFSNDDSVPVISRDQDSAWVKSQRSFSLSLFKTLNSGTSSQQNVVFSPSNIRDVLLLAYFGAARETEAALADVLQLPAKQTKPVTWRFYEHQRALNFGNNLTSHPVKSASKIFLSNKLYLRKCLAEKFENELELINYQEDVTWTKNYINNWVSEQTAGQIKDLIKELSPTATATLISAIYFKAYWYDKFDPQNSANLPFYVNKVPIGQTRMMIKLGHFDSGYCTELQARFAVLPYEGNRTAMIIILPDKDLDTMIKSMTEGFLSKLTDSNLYKTSYFKITIPTFEHDSDISLNAALQNLGIGNALTRSADFSFFTGKREIFFDKVTHQAKIKVDEEGTTASAATGIAMTNSLQLPSEPFVCNRPFAYIIYDYFQSKILFMGAFREPSSQ